MQTLQKLHLSNRLYMEQVTCHLLMPLLSLRACSEAAKQNSFGLERCQILVKWFALEIGWLHSFLYVNWEDFNWFLGVAFSFGSTVSADFWSSRPWICGWDCAFFFSYVCVYICMCVCVCMCLYVCVCVYICVYVLWVYIYMCILYVYICICVYMYVYIYIYVYMCVCVYIYIYLTRFGQGSCILPGVISKHIIILFFFVVFELALSCWNLLKVHIN